MQGAQLKRARWQDSSNVASKGAPAEDGQGLQLMHICPNAHARLAVSAVDRMANVFKNMGRVDFEKECKELRVKLQACEEAVATKVPLCSIPSRSAC